MQLCIFNSVEIIMLSQENEEIAKRYETKFYTFGLFGLLDEWFYRDFKETPGRNGIHNEKQACDGACQLAAYSLSHVYLDPFRNRKRAVNKETSRQAVPVRMKISVGMKKLFSPMSRKSINEKRISKVKKCKNLLKNAVKLLTVLTW